jgi:hypothetical protein
MNISFIKYFVPMGLYFDSYFAFYQHFVPNGTVMASEKHFVEWVKWIFYLLRNSPVGTEYW